MRRLDLVVSMACILLGSVHGFSAGGFGKSVSSERLGCFRLQDQQKPGSARFTGLERRSKDATSVVDIILRAIVSDVGSIVLGLAGLLIAVSLRIANQDSIAVEDLGQETRTDLLAILACGAVLLNGVSKLDVTSALAESVKLDGIALDKPELLRDTSTLLWALEALLAATPAMTAVLLEQTGGEKSWKIVARAGVVATDAALGTLKQDAPILNRFPKQKKETYLPTLQAIPGRVEFTYLPPNAQEALLLPVALEGVPAQVLVLASNTAKSFTPRDIAWSQVVATRIGEKP